MLFGLFGCRAKERLPISSLRFEVEHVFYIKPPVDRVILVGTVREGLVKTGDTVIVACREGNVDATVEGIEVLGPEVVNEAKVGQQVGLRLTGIRQYQATTGDWVLGQSGN